MFGKYVGKTPRELLNAQKGLYLMWCIMNIRGFHLEPSSLEDVVKERFMSPYLAVYSKRRK
jgi:hypothetical protein